MSKGGIKSDLDKLEKIASWFEKGEDIDVEEGIRKVKEGAKIIKSLKSRLKDVENEFNEVKAEIESL